MSYKTHINIILLMCLFLFVPFGALFEHDKLLIIWSGVFWVGSCCVISLVLLIDSLIRRDGTRIACLALFVLVALATVSIGTGLYRTWRDAQAVQDFFVHERYGNTFPCSSMKVTTSRSGASVR